ncbi:MAG: hypothetical protein M1820_002395 [Bogoriella megaspora]|nr:MAG: hypothetical protein M1820_002395 [Bogoriella megaspora]
MAKTVRDPKIAIIGAGLGGITLAIGLLNQPGIDPSSIHLYEAAQQFSEIGAGVASGPNAIRALRLTSAKIAEAYAKCVTHNADLELMSTWLGLRWGMPSRDGKNKAEGLMANIKYEPTPQTQNEELIPGKPVLARSCVHRAAFLDELVKLIPDGMCTFNKTLVGISDKPSEGPVILTFADGTTADADIVVACDGIKSRARIEIFGSEKGASSFTGQYAYRSLIPMQHAIDTLGAELAQNGQIYCGYRGYVITYPVEHGKLMNLVAIKQTKRLWPSDEPWVAPATREDMLKDFEGWSDRLLAMIKTIERPEKWALFDVQGLERFWKGRVCLMGDSAHSSTPHHGAGSGMAFEDAYVLSNLLGHYARSTSEGEGLDIEKIFFAYDAVRRERSQTLVGLSRDTGRLIEFEVDNVSDRQDAIVKLIQERYNWIWHWDLSGSLAKAMDIVRGSPSSEIM